MSHVVVCLLLLVPVDPGPLEVHPEDLAWLPSREMAFEQRVLTRDWRDQLAAQAMVDVARQGELETALVWARHCYRAWDALEDARSCWAAESEAQFLALERLRDEIGPAAYLAGRLPRVYERFARID